jgi:hypothetical protein
VWTPTGGSNNNDTLLYSDNPRGQLSPCHLFFLTMARVVLSRLSQRVSDWQYQWHYSMAL